MKENKALSSFVMLGICCFAGMISGCTTKPPSYSDVSNRIPALQQGYARVYVYCAQGSDGAHENCFKISIDDRRVESIYNGTIRSYNCLYVDHAAGKCKVTAQRMNGLPFLEQSKDLTLNLEQGETRYVQAEMNYATIPVKVRLIISDPDQAAPDLNKCFYVGLDIPGVPKQ